MATPMPADTTIAARIQSRWKSSAEVALLQGVEEVAIPDVEPERDADIGAAQHHHARPVSSQATERYPGAVQ